MWEFLTINGFWVCVVGLPVLGWIITEVVSNWRRVQLSENVTALKRSMVERGMSAEEIERVLRAGGRTDKPAE